MCFFSSFKTKKHIASPTQALSESLSPKSSRKNAFGGKGTAGTFNVRGSPNAYSRNRQGSANYSITTERVGAALSGSPKPPTCRSNGFLVCGSGARLPVRVLSATEPPAASPSLPKEVGKTVIMPPVLGSRRTPTQHCNSSARASTGRINSSPGSRSTTISSIPTSPQSDVTFPIQQSPAVGLSPSGIRAVRRPSVDLLAPLPGDSGKVSSTGLLVRTAVPSPPSCSPASTPEKQQSAWPKSPARAPAAAPPLPPPLPPTKTPLPAFTATESVPKRCGSSFRILKFRKSACEGTSTTSGGSISTTTNSNRSGNVMASVIHGKAAAGASNSSNSASGVICDSPRREPQVNSGRAGCSAQDKRCDPVVAFTDTVDSSPRRQKSSPSAIAHLVPTPPPIHVKQSGSFRGTVRTSQVRVSSMYSSHNTQSAEEVTFLENSVLVNRQQRLGVHSTTPCATAKAASNCSFSLDDIPRPLTRHASTLSAGQQEALRRTPSFLSRAHTPPPLSLRELVQMRKGRRVLQVHCSTPDAHATAPEIPSASEHSLSSSTTIMLSALLPSGEDDGKSVTVSSVRSSNKSLLLPGRDTGGGAGRQTPKGLAASSAGAASPKGPSASGSRSGGRTAGWRISTAKVLSEAGAVPDAPKPLGGETIKSPPLSCSPEPIAESAAAGVRDSKMAASVPSATRTSAVESTSSAPLPRVSQDLPRKLSSSMSLLLDEATTAFDFYGSYLLSPPQFTTEPQHCITTTPTPAGESAGTTSVEEVGEGQQPDSQQQPKSETFGSSVVNNAAGKEKKRNNVSISVSETVMLSVADPPGSASGKTALEDAEARKDEVVTSPVAPNQSRLSPSRVRAVRPASRQRVVSTYVDEDEEGFFQMARTNSTPASVSPRLQGTSYGTPSRLSASASANGYDYFISTLSTTKSFPSFLGETSPALPVSTVAPTPTAAKSVAPPPMPVTAAVAAASCAQLDLSSDDDGDDEEDQYDSLLEGFRPTGFDARRGARSSSSIVFYLNKEDSLSSLDIVVRVYSDPRDTGTISSSLNGSQVPPQNQKPPSTYAMPKPTTTTTGGGARPHVTFDPYVSESTHPTARFTPFTPISTLPNPPANKSLIAPSSPGLYCAVDTSSPSLQLSPSARGSRMALSQHSAAGVQTETLIQSDLVSIFLGTTARFAPDKSKMHRPLANTFGYTNAQRCARAAAMAAGVSAEEWSRAAGVDEDDVDSEEGIYGEVYTDENGDEWYWEEVEDEEYAEEEDEGENAGDAACALSQRGARVGHRVASTSSVSGVTTTATR